METYEDYQQAKAVMLAGLIGRFRVMTDPLWQNDATDLANFRQIAQDTLDRYDELMSPARKVLA